VGKRVRQKERRGGKTVAIKNDVATGRSRGRGNRIGQVLNHIFTCWKI
jgi:hypothetical protein